MFPENMHAVRRKAASPLMDARGQWQSFRLVAVLS